MKVDKSQKRLIRSGAWASLWNGFTAAYLVAFALALGASNTVVGIIGAVPFIARLFAELPGAKLLEYFHRKNIVVTAGVISRIAWLGIILVPFIFKDHPLIAIVLFYFISKFFGFLMEPSWVVMLADFIPVKIRGEFWAERQKLFGLFGMIAMVVGGWYLDLFTLPDFTGFVTIFAVGILFGFVTTYEIFKVKDKFKQSHEHHGFKEFFQLDGAVKKFTIFNFVFNFAVWLAAPLFAAYMLHDLSLSYTTFSIAVSVTLITKLLLFKHVGKLSDKFGDKPVLLLSVMGTSLSPLMFIFVTPETLWLIWPAQIINGIVWAGYDVTFFNMFLDVTTPEKRAVQTATFKIVTGVPLVIGPILGGFMADNLTFMLTGIPLVFAISSILRFGSSFFLIGMHESRAKKEYALSEVFVHAFEFHPSKGFEHVIGGVKKRGTMFLSMFK
jgi:MFS family permease